MYRGYLLKFGRISKLHQLWSRHLFDRRDYRVLPMRCRDIPTQHWYYCVHELSYGHFIFINWSYR